MFSKLLVLISLVIATASFNVNAQALAAAGTVTHTEDITKIFSKLSKLRHARMITPAGVASIGLAAIFYKISKHDSETFVEYASTGMFEQVGSKLGTFLYDILHNEEVTPDVGAYDDLGGIVNDPTASGGADEVYGDFDNGPSGPSWEVGDIVLLNDGMFVKDSLSAMNLVQARMVLDEIDNLKVQLRCGGYRPNSGCRVILDLEKEINYYFNL